MALFRIMLLKLHTYIHTFIHVYIHIYMHACMHIFPNSSSQRQKIWSSDLFSFSGWSFLGHWVMPVFFYFKKEAGAPNSLCICWFCSSKFLHWWLWVWLLLHKLPFSANFVVCISASKLSCVVFFFLAQSFLFLGWNSISLKHIIRRCSWSKIIWRVIKSWSRIIWREIKSWSRIRSWSSSRRRRRRRRVLDRFLTLREKVLASEIQQVLHFLEWRSLHKIWIWMTRMKQVLSIAAAAAAADVGILTTSVLREVLLHSFYGG